MIREAYIEETTMRKIEAHAEQAAKNGNECMGLLAGEACEWNGKKFVVATEYITAQNSATPISVRFEESSFSNLAQQINNAVRQQKIIVGWSHSHPSFGCFLSTTDVRTQQNYFPEEFHVALVVDPLKTENGKMLKRFFKLNENGNGFREASFAVYGRK